MAKRKKRKKAKVVSIQPKMSLEKYIKLKARNLEIHEIYISDNLFESGKGHVIFVRKKRNGQKIIGVYLVDSWCLGVKDTFSLMLEDYEYPEFIERFQSDPNYNIVPCDPNHACNVVYGAVEYAEDIGIDPHKDFDITEYILLDVDEVEYEELEFGYNGKPHFMAYDTDNRGAIISKLNASVGNDGYIYTDGEVYIKNMDGTIHEQAAEEHLSEEEDIDAYLAYVAVLKLIENATMEDVEKYKKLYIDDAKEFLRVMYVNGLDVLRVIAIESGDEIETMDYKVLSVAENYFINEGTDFILKDLNVIAFDESMANHNLTILYDANLHNYGKDKLDILVSLATTYLEMGEYEEKDIAAVKKIYSGETELVVDMSPAFYLLSETMAFLEGYESLYGEINFDEISILEFT